MKAQIGFFCVLLEFINLAQLVSPSVALPAELEFDNISQTNWLQDMGRDD